MGFQIENAEQLQQLISENALSIESIDQLVDLLGQLKEQDPAQRKEELAHKERVQKEEFAHEERLQEREHAHLERLRNLEHMERLRALELGQPLPNPGETDRSRSAIRAAASIGILVPLMLTCAAVGLDLVVLRLVTTPSDVLFFGLRVDLQAALFAMVWGVSCLLVLITVLASLLTAGRAGRPSPRQQQPLRSQQPALQDRPNLPVEKVP